MGSYSRTIKGIDGIERTYTFKPLDVEAAIDLEDELWRTVAEFISATGPEAASVFGDASDSDSLRAGMSALSSVPAAVFRALPKDRLRQMSKKLLAGCQINAPDGSLFTLSDGWSDEYMVGRWPERISALVEAIDVSFPGYFSKAQTFVKDFVKSRLSQIFSKAKTTESRTE